MKRRLVFVILSVAALCIVGFTTENLRGSGNSKSVSYSTSSPPQQKRQKKPDPPGTIDGAKNPEMIPDRVAYMLLFRFISNHRKNETEQKQIREYVRQIGLGKQRRCPPSVTPEDCSLPDVVSNDSDIDALIAAAESFQQRVSVLDAQAKEIKDRTWPNPRAEVMAQLTSLQRQKESLADELIASLSSRVSVAGLQRLSKHINQRIKHLTKRFPGPPSLPDGHGWREHSPKRHP
jgi:hypothetical protein